MEEISDDHKRMIERIVGNVIEEVEKETGRGVTVDILDDENSISIILIFPECVRKNFSK